MIGTTLQNLIEKVRAEARLSTNTSRGIDNRANIVQVVNRCYEELYDEYAWENLRIQKSVDMEAGERYYDFPSTIDLPSVERVWVQHDSARFPLEQGIDPVMYNVSDSDNTDRASHPSRWDYHRDDSSGNQQFEVWPTPDQDGTDDAPIKVWFRGKLKFAPMVNNGDKCLIDDQLVVLYAASEILAANKQPDAQLKQQKATNRLNKMKAMFSDNRAISVGGNDPHQGTTIPKLRTQRTG